jgi:predicted DCC family thiol-disulfide oxidoreductase YuxK
MAKVTVWFDNNCPLCQREIALMRRLDRRGRIAFLDATDPDTHCPIDRAEILARFHAEENGKMLSGAAAFAAMWRAIPVLWPLGMMAKLPGAERVLNWAYGYFLWYRPKLQRMMK